jgi:hypothetical protein
MTLIMTADFADRTYDSTSEEYEILTRLKKDFPGLKVARKTHRTPAKYKTKGGEEYTHNQFKDLTYKRMEKFLSRIPNGESFQKEYDCVKDFATDLNGNGYPIVRKWFVEQFPHFRKNPLFYVYNTPSLVPASHVIAEVEAEAEVRELKEAS